jgi:hypothetical protein
MIETGVIDPETLLKAETAVANAKSARDAKLGPIRHAEILQQQILQAHTRREKLAAKLADLQRQALEIQQEDAKELAREQQLIAQEVTVTASIPQPVDAPLAHGLPIAFRDHLRAIQTLEEQLETIAHNAPCEPLRLTIAGLKRLFTDSTNIEVDDDSGEQEVRIDDDDFKRFAEAAQSLDGLEGSPDRFNALQECFKEAVTNATRRSLESATSPDDKSSTRNMQGTGGWRRGTGGWHQGRGKGSSDSPPQRRTRSRS